MNNFENSIDIAILVDAIRDIPDDKRPATLRAMDKETLVSLIQSLINQTPEIMGSKSEIFSYINIELADVDLARKHIEEVVNILYKIQSCPVFYSEAGLRSNITDLVNIYSCLSSSPTTTLEYRVKGQITVDFINKFYTMGLNVYCV